MNRISIKIVLLLLVCLPCSIVGQGNKPLWTDADMRNMEYPAETYYTGFSTVSVQKHENINDVVVRAKQAAISELSQRIRVTVNTYQQSKTVSIDGSDMDEQIRAMFSSVISTNSNTDMIGSMIETWYDQCLGEAFAFACVNKQDLEAYYQKQIILDLAQVETALNTSKQLVVAGKKMNARSTCFNAKKKFQTVLYYQYLLSAVNPNVTDENLQTERIAVLQQNIEQVLIDLEQSTFVYVDCKWELKGNAHDVFYDDPGIICDIIKQALSENDCSVVDNNTEADYTLTIIASTTRRTDGSGQYGIISYYANVIGSLYNHLTKKKTVDFAIFNDPDAYAAGKTSEIAATKAFKLTTLKEKILEKVLPRIKN